MPRHIEPPATVGKFLLERQISGGPLSAPCWCLVSSHATLEDGCSALVSDPGRAYPVRLVKVVAVNRPDSSAGRPAAEPRASRA